MKGVEAVTGILKKFRRGELGLLLLLILPGLSVQSQEGSKTPETKLGRGGVVAVGFTSTPAPTDPMAMVRVRTTSKVVFHYADGSTTSSPLSYHVLFRNVDRVGNSGHEAGRLFDVKGNPLVDRKQYPIIAETPDSNSLLKVGKKLFLVTHYEYDWILGDGSIAWQAEKWHSRMPMSMSLTTVEQQDRGLLRAVAQRRIDFSGVNGLWIPCFGSQTPWNTHLGGEEDYDLFYIEESGPGNYRQATRGLKALSEIYFRGKPANPYHYGYLTEVRVHGDGSTDVTKHYNLGRATWEMGLVMPDQRTVYFGDDGDHTGFFLFVADREKDLSSGTIYAARWSQVSHRFGGAAVVGWIKLGHITRKQAQEWIDGRKLSFADLFETTTPKKEPGWKEKGFRSLRSGHGGNEYLRLKPGMEMAAACLETRRYASYLGATTEFNKMEGVAVDREKKNLYVSMSKITGGMQRAVGVASADHIQVAKVSAGGVFQVRLAGGQTDRGGQEIRSEWVATGMFVPRNLLGRDIGADALGNTADPERIGNPDNLYFSEKMRTLFVGEDSGSHVNNFLWAYQVDTGKLTRILCLPSGAEATGLQVVENLDGKIYVLCNAQHQGEWIDTLPLDLRGRLKDAARAIYGVSSNGVLNYYLQAPIGYIHGIPNF